MNGHIHGPSFDRVIDALRSVAVESTSQSGEWTKFHCPVPTHGKGRGDRNPSLGVKYDPRREKTIVTCFSRCDQDDVLGVAGLRVRDLFDRLPDRTPSTYRPLRQHPPAPSTPAPHRTSTAPADDLGEVTGPRRRVATYTYTTVGKDPVGQVIRYATPHEHGTAKDFSQRRWDPERQGWVAGGFAPVLYQAPIVAWAIAEGHPILVCEGEKDVDRATAAGYPATCNAAGAGKFRPEHAEQLRGASHVVIVADRDLPGFQHAAQVYDRLQGVARHIDVMHTASGKDLFDHLDAGHDINDLRLIRPDQLNFVRQDPARGGTGPRRPADMPHGDRTGWPGRQDLDWGLDR
ncbi:hypothetical protein AB0C65_32845 [Nocardia sp. NPDC048505]|uniref:hypothetical protein n=1 Tax=Nocardia sp. NPDC048505 TaxID=3155756 RepID=UPI0033E1364A